MPNWCENDVLIRGRAEDIQRYKDSLLKDSTGKFYPWISTVPLPELENELKVEEYIVNNKTLFPFHHRVVDLVVIENNSEELVLHFETAYSNAQTMDLCTDDLFLKLSIFHKYFEPHQAYHGFNHYVKGKLIASGYEEGEEQLSPWQMFEYNPWPPGVDPLAEKLKHGYIVVSQEDLTNGLEGEK